MSEHKINIFLRLRPTKAKKASYELLEENSRIVVEVPKDNIATEVVNNSKERHEFKFNQIFDCEARQEDVFNAVAQPAVQVEFPLRHPPACGFMPSLYRPPSTGSTEPYLPMARPGVVRPSPSQAVPTVTQIAASFPVLCPCSSMSSNAESTSPIRSGRASPGGGLERQG